MPPRGHCRSARANPRGYIAQEIVQLSTHPTFVDGHLEPRHVDLRPFVLSGDRTRWCPAASPGGAEGLPDRELLTGRRVQGHMGAGQRERCMLSRHAEDLYCGRYVERAEDTARMLDVTYHNLLESLG